MSIVRFSHPAYLVLLLVVIPALLYPVYKWGPRGSQTRLPVLVRLASAVLLVLALSGVQITRGSPQTSLVFVIDRSDSIAQPDRSGALEYLNNVASQLTKGDEAGVVVFGKDAVIEQRFQGKLRVADIQSTPVSTGTNIEKGLLLARTMLASKPNASRRIILMTDGNQTSGDARREASIAAAEGIEIDSLPLATAAQAAGRKIFLQEVSGPESARVAEPFDIRIVLSGNPRSNVNLRLYRDGKMISERSKDIGPAGVEVISVPERLTTAGFHQYRIQAQNPDKNHAEDADESGLVVYAHGRTSILHIAATPAAFLDEILRKQGFEVVAVAPQNAPRTIQDLAPYDAVILDNAPASAFTEDQMRILAEHVERHGGGLIMIGSTGSFGPGGYTGTRIEELLPVDTALKNREKKPPLAVVLVLDKSGSMGMEQRNVSKIDMAKDAVLRLSELLSPEDYLGIVAFDRSPVEILPLHLGPDRLTVERSIRSLNAGGGTSIFPAIEMAYKWLDASMADRKHIVLLSDGQAEQAERKPLTDRVAGSRTTLSTVGIGSDVDRALMQTLAERGHGRAYYTETGLDLPDIFKREALLLSGKWIVEHIFFPRQSASHEILQGLGNRFPEISGYIATTAKNLSETLLAADNGDPILACRRSGLGKTLVLTSDLSSLWARRLIEWDQFAGFWTRMLRWASRSTQSTTMHARVIAEGDDALLSVDSFDAAGEFQNLTDVRARVEGPDSIESDIDMRQTSAGRYEGRMSLSKKGTYLFTMVAKAEGAETALHAGIDLSKFPENRQHSTDLNLLSGIAQAANGRLLNRDGVPQIRRSIVPQYIETWQFFASAALLLFFSHLVLARRALQ